MGARLGMVTIQEAWFGFLTISMMLEANRLPVGDWLPLFLIKTK